MSKQELLARNSPGVTKVVHRGNWFAMVKRALGIR